MQEEDYNIIAGNNLIDLDKEDKELNNAINISICEKNTDDKTQKNQNGSQNSNFASQNKKIAEDNIPLNYSSFEDIIDIFCKKNSLTNFRNIFKKNKFIDSLQRKLLKKKRIRENKEKKINDLNENEINEKKTKRGRKPDPFINREEHNNKSSDNIIIKIKGKLFNYLVIFMNNILEKKENDKEKIYNINYKLINQLNKKNDLELLEKSIKDILSMDITPKIKTLFNDTNKIFIKKLENKEMVEDFDTVNFVLNLKFRDFLALFTFKKNIKEIIIEKGLEEYDSKINIKKIEESLIGVDDLLNKIYEKNQDLQYLSSFIFHLYNYEQWFYIKSPRNNTKSI